MTSSKPSIEGCVGEELYIFVVFGLTNPSWVQHRESLASKVYAEVLRQPQESSSLSSSSLALSSSSLLHLYLICIFLWCINFPDVIPIYVYFFLLIRICDTYTLLLLFHIFMVYVNILELLVKTVWATIWNIF